MTRDDSQRSVSTLLWLVLVGAGSLLTGLGFAIVGLIVGAAIGGNYAVDFRFAGNRGYEATGLLGAIIGFPVGVIIGASIGSVVVRLCRRT